MKTYTEDFVKEIPVPSVNFNQYQFYTKCGAILEEMLDEILSRYKLKPARTLNYKIIRLRSMPGRSIPNKLIKALHRFRAARNEFIHSVRASKKAYSREKRYIYATEKAFDYAGIDFLSSLSLENRRQWRIYYGFALIWEYLIQYRDENFDYYPARELMNAIAIELVNIEEKFITKVAT